MEHVNGWCFRGIYKGGIWENDLHVSAHEGIDTNITRNAIGPKSGQKDCILRERSSLIGHT